MTGRRETEGAGGGEKGGVKGIGGGVRGMARKKGVVSNEQVDYKKK